MNALMYRELAHSLSHVWDEGASILSLPVEPRERLIAALIHGSSYPSGIFARYYEFVDAIIEERYADAATTSAEICSLTPWRSGRVINVLGSPELGDETARYLRLMNSDPTLDLGLACPDPKIAEDFKLRLEAGLAILQKVLPDLAGEFDAIIREIVIVGGDASKPTQFDGGSHAQLWGSLFLNAQFHPDPIAVVEVLAHESAHSLLFGFCTHDNLVLNDEAERFASPLRSDPRPMEGIYHATFVSARMHWAMSKVAASPLVSEVDQDRARAAAAADLANFQAGNGVVEQYGKLSSLGLSLMTGARRYMASAT